MSVYGIVRTRDGLLHEERVTNKWNLGSCYRPCLFGSFQAAVECAESLGHNCMVVELAPRANIRHERTHRIIIDPLL